MEEIALLPRLPLIIRRSESFGRSVGRSVRSKRCFQRLSGVPLLYPCDWGGKKGEGGIATTVGMR